MKISLNWLRRLVEWQMPLDELCRRLTMAGFEVESVDDLGAKFRGFVVGHVLDVSRHPKADRLTVCSVDTGRSEPVPIVCGAPNVAPGQKVAVGEEGALVPRNQHDPEGKPFSLSRVKIRGVESRGMICSTYELGLGDDKDGILVLDPAAKVGTPLSEFLELDDVILEIGVTPNRPDALSHVGIAREVAAISGTKLEQSPISISETGMPAASQCAVIIENPADCPRYSARIVRGVTVGPSPGWLQRRLKQVGIRPVNNIVDATNYVLLETGQPLHAFDEDRIKGKAIIVRNATAGEEFVTLDHTKRTLDAGMLMICDASRSIGIAGVMGGLDTEIASTTNNVLIESAYFNPRSIRRTSKRLSLSTDASQRFERGADPSGTVRAADRAAALIQQMAGGHILSGCIDVYPKSVERRQIHLEVEHANRILGTELSLSSIADLLQSIDLEVIAESNGVRCLVPTFRPDLERPIDLIEEVARLYGYDNIETRMRSMIHFLGIPDPPDFSVGVREWFIGRGFHEIVTNSMQDSSLTMLSTSTPVEVTNPISKDLGALRTELMTSALSVVRNNLFHGVKDLRLFEIGKIYTKTSTPTSDDPVPGFLEEERLSIIICGNNAPAAWDGSSRPVDIFDMKGELEAFFTKIFLDKHIFIPYSSSKALTESTITVEINGEPVGEFGRVRHEILKKFEIEQDVIVAEFRLQVLAGSVVGAKKFEPLPHFPAVFRDLALTVGDEIQVGSLMESFKASGGELLVGVRLFDMYKGDQIPDGKKSCAFSFEFLSTKRTLLQSDIDLVMQRIIQDVSARFGAVLRM